MWIWFTRFDRLGPCDPFTKRMSPMDYDMVVNVKAYSLVKTPQMLPLTWEHDGLSNGTSSRKLWLKQTSHKEWSSHSIHSFLNPFRHGLMENKEESTIRDFFLFVGSLGEVSVFYRRVLRGVSRGEWLWVRTRRHQNAMVHGTQGFRQVWAARA